MSEKFVRLFLLQFLMTTSSAEYVPVFIWESERMKESTEEISPLEIVRKNWFEDFLSIKFDKYSTIVLFIEKNLSVEDFHKIHNATVLLFLSSLVDDFGITYLPNVKNPTEIIKNMITLKEQQETSFENINSTRRNFYIVDLENRIKKEKIEDILSRHDFIIMQIYSHLLEICGDDILAIFTGEHNSWASLFPSNYRHKTMKLLESKKRKRERKTVLVDDKNLLLVTTGDAKYSFNGNKTSINLTQTDLSYEDETIILTLSGTDVDVVFVFKFLDNMYWKLESVYIDEEVAKFRTINLPLSYSYHCSEFKISVEGDNKRYTHELFLFGFQVQPFKNGKEKPTFGLAQDCVGFTSIAILSGIFVCAILLVILFYGIISMMDIRTPDRFDDPEEKPFHVPVE